MSAWQKVGRVQSLPRSAIRGPCRTTLTARLIYGRAMRRQEAGCYCSPRSAFAIGQSFDKCYVSLATAAIAYRALSLHEPIVMISNYE